jgi:hypothetical protein
MGNNAAFSSFEASVMAVYKRGKLDKKLLSDLMEPYRDMDIDSGGKEGLFVKKNGRVMEVEDVVIEIFTGKFFEPPKLPNDCNTWTPEQYQANDDYQEKRGVAFNKITDKFGWS